MINWIKNNREWLFSGIGVTVLVGPFSLVVWLLPTEGRIPQTQPQSVVTAKLPDSSESKTPVNPNPFKSKTLVTPNSIFTSVEAVPPFQRATVLAQYEGIPVRWHTIFLSANPWFRDRDYALVIVHYGKDPLDSPMISLIVSVVENPNNKVATKGAHVIVSGEIHITEDRSIHLEKANLEFE